MRMTRAQKTAVEGFSTKANVEGQVGKDMGMLRDLVGALTEAASKGGIDGRTAAAHLTTFSDILDGMESARIQTLTERQRGFLRGVHTRYCKGESYRNDWSAGRVEKGRDVPLPAVLQNLPKKPPTRMAPQ
jgi:hypothetical protein